MRQGQRQRPRARRSGGGGACPHLPDVVVIFGNIGEMREIAEGTDDANGLADRHAVEDDFQFMPRRLVLIPVEPDRGLPNAFDQFEHVGAFLIAHGVAEDASEPPDVFTHPRVPFDGGDTIAPVGTRLSIGRHDLGRHSWLLQKLARPLLSRNFSSPVQVQEKGDPIWSSPRKRGPTTLPFISDRIVASALCKKMRRGLWVRGARGACERAARRADPLAWPGPRLPIYESQILRPARSQ